MRGSFFPKLRIFDSEFFSCIKVVVFLLLRKPLSNAVEEAVS